LFFSCFSRWVLFAISHNNTNNSFIFLFVFVSNSYAFRDGIKKSCFAGRNIIGWLQVWNIFDGNTFLDEKINFKLKVFKFRSILTWMNNIDISIEFN
jgi:hypothetical protein